MSVSPQPSHVRVFIGLLSLLLIQVRVTAQPTDPNRDPRSSESRAPELTADLILHGGFVWTVDETNPIAEAIAVRNGRILALGPDAEILLRQEPDTRVIDLEGAFLLPGFNDNHIHFQAAAAFHEFNIMRTSTQADFIERLQNAVLTLPKGEWITGGYWGAYDEWAHGSAGEGKRDPFTPDIWLVDVLTKDHPMFLRKFDDSEFAINSAAVTAVGLDPDNLSLEGMSFLSRKDGTFSGIFRGDRSTVLRLFHAIIPPPSLERRLRQSRHALNLIARAGVTNVSDMSDFKQLEIFRELHKRGELTVQVHCRPPLDEWEMLAENGIGIGSGNEWIRLGAVKGHIDGIMGTSTARFFEPYSSNPANRGRWRKLMVDEEGNFVEGKFLTYMIDADRAGLQLSVHAIGDEANYLLLNYLEELNRQNGLKDRRFRLVHAQVIAPTDFARLGSLNVVAEVQPFHLSDDMRWMEERIGYQRCLGAYAFKSILESGATLCFGTDWPGTSAAEYPINPLLGLYAAVTRKTVTGDPPDGWFPEQRITIEEAIRAYTLGTAYANFEDESKGSIEPGKIANLTVLSKNLLHIPPEEIPSAEVLFTIVSGRIVYEKPKQ